MVVPIRHLFASAPSLSPTPVLLLIISVSDACVPDLTIAEAPELLSARQNYGI